MRRLALALLLFTLPALADNTADEADVAFRQGNEAYAKRAYERALGWYFLSHRLVQNRNVLFNIARCYEELGRFDEAYRYYHDLGTKDLPADDAREVKRAMARIRPKVALLTVETKPPGADVFLDREDLGSRGRSPLTIALAPGRHRVLAKQAGFRPGEAAATLVRGAVATLQLELERILGAVEFTGTPAGASIRETPDGAVLGALPSTVSFAPGQRLLYLSAPGFLRAQVLVDVKADARQTVKVELAAQPAPTGKVIVTSNRENAVIRVDGKEAGFTPTVLLLTVGEHELEVSMKDLQTFRKRIGVAKDAESRIDAELRYAPPPVQAASKALGSVDEAPASTTVITAAEIRSFGYRTLAEALAATRGVFLSDDRIYTYLGVRGFSPPGDLNTRVLILWDGHAMNDIWAGQGYAARDLTVDLDEVERIEVVRGPGSALYGTGAFFAVINVVPRNSLGEAAVEGSGAVGALSAYRGRLTAALPGDGESGALVSLAGYGARGADTTDLGERGLAVGLDRERAYNGVARARYRGFTLSAQVNHREKDIPTAPFETVANLPGTRSLDSRGFAEVRYDRALGETSAVSVRGYYDASRYNGSWLYEVEGGDPELQTDSGSADWAGGEARLRFAPFRENQLTVGVEGQQQLRIAQQVFGRADLPTLETRSRTLFSAYLLDEWRVSPRLLVSAGLRADRYFDLSELPITPRLAVVFRPYERGLTKVVAGTAFRAPNVYELYYSDNNLTQRTSPNLAAETIATVELEHSHDLTEELRLTAGAYANQIRNLVIYGYEPGGDPICGPAGDSLCQMNQNAPGALNALGAEAELRWQPGRFALVDLSYSFVRLSSAEGEVPSVAPAHLASGRLLVPLGESGARFAAQASYRSASPPPGASGDELRAGEVLLVSLAISGEVGAWRYLASVQNLLDAGYALPIGDGFRKVPQYGRTLNFELGARF